MTFGIWRYAFVLILVFASLGNAQDDLARELPRIKPLEPAAALKSFRIHAGFSPRAGGGRAAGHRPRERLL